MCDIKIGGFVKQSLIDYPGKIAAVIFTQGCNFRCGYCHNPQLVLPEQFTAPIPEKEVMRSLQHMQYWLDAVVISGGEPTIHAALPGFIREIKKLGFLVKLDTNGSNPVMLQQLLNEKLVDFVAMDIKTLPEPLLYSRITGKKDMDMVLGLLRSSIQIIRQSGIGFEFRTTVIPEHHSKQLIEQIASLLDAKEQYKTNPYREGLTVASNADGIISSIIN